MSKRIMKDVKCPSCGHADEQLVPSDQPSTECANCGQLALFALAAPLIKLEGVSGAFPTAYDRWNRQHVEASRIANKRMEGKYE